MIAVRPISGKIGKKSFKILEGRSIPKHLLESLDIEILLKSGAIKDEKKSGEKESKIKK